MTLLAILILLQTPSLHLGGPDAAIPQRDVDQRTIAPLIRGIRPVSFPSDPTGIGECANGAWADDAGAGSLLDVPVLPRLCRKDSRPSRLCPSPLISSHSVRSRPLRC
jgi:hypothetical protein